MGNFISFIFEVTQSMCGATAPVVGSLSSYFCFCPWFQKNFSITVGQKNFGDKIPFFQKGNFISYIFEATQCICGASAAVVGSTVV